jgi:demethylmenaquinone methyltransferase/2-methoxy-6-polyprenyl-1,4-benzoquinol methylase
VTEPAGVDQQMSAYYDAQAKDYEAFYRGEGQAVPGLGATYRHDTAKVSELLAGFGRGEVLDLACGTGFWLDTYGRNSRFVTLVDQSAAALTLCARRVIRLGMRESAELIQGDVFSLGFPPASFDAVLLGFLISHLTPEQLDRLFKMIRRALHRDGVLAVVDSAWSEGKEAHRAKAGLETRRLDDGREFTIRKQYFAPGELEALLTAQGFTPTASYAGEAFVAALARPPQ